MDRQNPYYRQVQLLLQLIPLIARHDCFALKGGTAINLFIRDFPRLSVDIDLVFLPGLERTAALQMIREHLEILASEIESERSKSRVTRAFQNKEDALRLLVGREGVQVKIELSPVLRGSVYAPSICSVSDAVEREFGFAEMRVLSFADVYAGKLCAALDRQHPRDLFDVKFLLDHEGLTNELRQAFLVYLISHPRPMAELLRPHFKDITDLYYGEFRNMTDSKVPLADLQAVQKAMVKQIHEAFTARERMFLLSFKNQTPDWSLLEISGADQLPAVRWKLQNLAKMPTEKQAEFYQKLKVALQK